MATPGKQDFSLDQLTAAVRSGSASDREFNEQLATTLGQLTELYESGELRTLVPILPLLQLKGKPFRLADYGPFEPMYKRTIPKQTLFAAGSLSSVVEDHIELFPDNSEFASGPVQVKTITLNELLDQRGVEKIDFLSMDIEQAEPAALAGFDIERFRPELVCIEATESVRKAIAAYFDAHGYERIDAYLSYDPVNWYYRPRPPTWPATVASGAVAVILGAGLVFALQRRAGSRTAEEPA